MQSLKLARKYPQFSQEEILGLVQQFQTIDTESTGSVPQSVILSSLPTYSYDQIRSTLKTVSIDSSGQVELEDFVELISKLRIGVEVKSEVRGVIGGGAGGTKTMKVGGGVGAVGVHSVDEEERRGFTSHINSVLSGDVDIGDRIPIDLDTMRVFDECKDGLVLCKLLNDAVPDTIDERVLNRPKNGKPINQFQLVENNNLLISSCKSVGIKIVNIGSQDLINGSEILILAIIWQIIRKSLLEKIDIKHHPELFRLLEDGEELEAFLKLPPDQILLRWFNYHLQRAGWHRTVTNFSKDIMDGENYTVLLAQIQPQECNRNALQTTNLLERAEQVLESADRIGCRKYLTPTSLVSGNSKLNLAFIANLFNTHPSLEAFTEAEPHPVIEAFDAEGLREARVFTLWLNSLEVNPGVYNLFEDLKDGNVLLQAFEKTFGEGSVVWKRVGKAKEGMELSRFKMVENCNYVIELGGKAGLILVGVQGADLVDGSQTLTLGLVWQLMRRSIISILASLTTNGKEITDSQMISWANKKVSAGGKSSKMTSFRDKSLGNGLFFLDLLDCLKPGYVDYDLVYRGNNEEECKANAKLAISIARKLGSLIFIVAEDIVEVRARLILTFIAALMALDVKN